MSQGIVVYCIGRNYRKHAEELGSILYEEPVVFLKAASSLRGLEPEPMAFAQESFHHEAELVLQIGKTVPMGRQAGWDHVEAVALGLDLTRREAQSDLKKKGLPWTLAKSFKGAAVVGPFISPKRFPNLDDIHFTLSVNGALRQEGHTAVLLHPIPKLLTFLATFNDLHPGDLVFTGTPEGVGPIRVGDTFELSFPQIQGRFSGRL